MITNRSRFSAMAAAVLVCGVGWVGSASAHTAWFEPQGGSSDRFVLLFGGHAGATGSYAKEKVKSIGALDRNGQSVDLTRSDTPQGVVVAVTPAVSVLTVHFDNGFFSRGADGRTVPRSMREVPGASKGTWAIKWGKTITQWSPAAAKPAGQPFEVVPLDVPRANQPMRVQVLIDGKPAPGIQVARDELLEGAVKTDAQGIAPFTPKPGWNRVWAGQRTPAVGEPDYTERSVEVMLVFEARPQ